MNTFKIVTFSFFDTIFLKIDMIAKFGQRIRAEQAKIYRARQFISAKLC